jgi:DNA polymerase III delta prime subunit
MQNELNAFEPRTLSEFVISNPVSRLTLESILAGRVPFPAFGKSVLCLWGTYGSGKTSLAKRLPAWLEQSGHLRVTPRAMVLFGADFTHFTPCGSGSNSTSMMQDLHTRTASEVSYSETGWHFEIFDEADLLTANAQASLKAAITQAENTIFILTTNHLNRLDGGLRDRAHLIEMNQPPATALIEPGRRMLQKMGLTGEEVSEEVLIELASTSRGSMRDFCNSIAILGAGHGGAMP